MDHKDKHIDKLFRDGLNNPDIPFDEGNWDAMESRLDAHKPKRKIVPMLWIGLSGIAAAILLVFLFGLWPAKQPENTGTTAARQPKKTAPPALAQPSAAEGIQPSIKDPARQAPGALKNPVYATSGKTGQEPARSSIALQAGSISAQQGQPLVAAHEIIIPNLSSPTTERPKPLKEPRARPYLSIMAAPDLSGVQGAGDPQLSANVGLLYTLPISGKFSISAGVLYAKKNYNTPYSKYGRTFDRWYNPSDQVYANCDVLEIPVLVNYEVYDRRNTSVQVATGLSSYFMLREKYDFAEAPGKPVFWSYEVSGKNNHPFGIANVSVMVEQRVSNRFSIGLNPFIKLPLTGIGDGRLKLQSQGVAISVNYMLGRKP